MCISANRSLKTLNKFILGITVIEVLYSEHGRLKKYFKKTDS